MPRSGWLWALSVVVVMGGAGGTMVRNAVAAAGATRPNVVFVLTDDLDTAELRYMPHTRALIGAMGATFDRYYVSNSLCCPSRVTTLRGQYSHNTGVWTNGGDNGGFERAYSTGLEADTVATRLRAAGYLTSLTGKYLNGYPNGAPLNYMPPGWTNWASPVWGNPYSEYHYVLNQNGVYHVYGHRRTDYGTDVYTGLTDQFVRQAAREHRPFFADLSVYAPHQPATPAREDRIKYATAVAPRTPSYNQADVSRSPGFVRRLPAFTTVETDAIDRVYRQRIRSLQAVDRGVAELVHTLRATGELANTYIVFASDNGFHLGQHRMPAGKQTAYETDIRVPLLVRGPGIKAGQHVTRLTGNVDLAPTFEAMAGVQPARFTDGRSMLPLMNGAAPGRWRRSYLVEHRNETGAQPSGRPDAATSSPLEPPDPEQAPQIVRPGREIRDNTLMVRYGRIPDYEAVRTARYLYVEYVNGERELYDTRADPDEIDNLAGRAPPGVQHALSVRLHQLARCHASRCRAAEDEAVPG
jgi:N-acetylglucosamine-6-sulfatase